MWVVKEVFTYMYSKNAVTILHISVINSPEEPEEHFIQNVVCGCFEDSEKMKEKSIRKNVSGLKHAAYLFVFSWTNLMTSEKKCVIMVVNITLI